MRELASRIATQDGATKAATAHMFKRRRARDFPEIPFPFLSVGGSERHHGGQVNSMHGLVLPRMYPTRINTLSCDRGRLVSVAGTCSVARCALVIAGNRCVPTPDCDYHLTFMS